MGCADRQCHRNEPVLVEYGDLHYVGRLGWLVRSCRTGDCQFLRIRLPRAPDRDLALRETAYVSHVRHDFGSILKFIEETFNLPSLGYADLTADDLSDCFNFNQSPLTFQTIPAPLDAAHFLNDRRAPTNPDD